MSTRQINWLFKELPKLISEKVIDAKAAEKIRTHYEKKAAKKINIQNLLLIFGAIGAVLLGGGILLILAHNWGMFPKYVRLFLGMAPLLITLGLSGVFLYRERDSVVGREILGVLTALLMGAAIAIVGQVYHLPGNLSGFLLLWSIGIIPTIYLLRSNYTLITFLVLITSRSAYVQDQGGHALYYWLLLIAIIPYLMRCFGTLANLDKHAFIKWVMVISLGTALGISLEKVVPGLWIVVYASFFTMVYLLGCHYEQSLKSLWQKPMQVMGMGGIGYLAFLLAMSWPWEEMGLAYIRHGARFHTYVSIADYIILAIFLSIAVLLFIRLWEKFKPYMIVFASLPVLAIVSFLRPDYGVWIFGIYISVLSFSLIVDRGGTPQQSLLQKYGYLLLALFLSYLLVEYRGRMSLHWIIAVHCFFVLLCMQSNLFIEKSSTFLDGLTKFVGFVGGLIFLYILTFRGVVRFSEYSISFIFILPIIIGTAYQAIPFVKQYKQLGWFLVSLPIVGLVSTVVPISTVLLYNLYFLAASVGIILLGLGQNKLSYSNSGLLLAALLIFTRFFDSDMSFLGRGIVFVLLGSLFLGMNIYIIKKRKSGASA